MVHNDIIDHTKSVWPHTLFNELDVVSFRHGLLFDAHEKFGSHAMKVGAYEGFYFAVWAPAATEVSVVGEFNGWKKSLHILYVRTDSSGIWEGFIPRIQAGVSYKYFIKGFEGIEKYKADPYANYCELRPGTASVTHNYSYDWKDHAWMEKRKHHNALNAPWNVYEVHLGSWMRPDKQDPEKFNSYIETAERLVPYVKAMGFTHVEIMPVMEFPYDGSWGYQCTGYFSPTSRFGTPEQFKYLVDEFHKNDIGVILDWVPSHFPGDEHGLYLFDGAHTYEYADMRKGFHKDWNSYIFNYKRGEVRSFLISSAHYWLKEFHADGLRVDAVNSIIRLDFSRGPGEWQPNELGTNANLEAIAFLKDLNRITASEFSDIQMIAEEASDWPNITAAVNKKGLGFGMKWMMGWMHDSFRYFKKPWEERKLLQNDLTFSIMYFYDEKFMLPISHDEVVHGKSPMIYKFPGDEFRRFATLRLLYAYMMMHPGAKLLFMGCEFGQTNEWDYNSELQWELLQFDPHNKLQECVRALNHIYKNEPALYERQFDKKGFSWLSLDNPDKGVLAFRRSGKDKNGDIVVIMNVSENDQENWELNLSGKSEWRERLNTNDLAYYGSGEFLNLEINTTVVDKRKKLYKIKVNLPSFSIVVIQ